MTVLETGNAIATNGREGHVKTDDGKIDLALSPPGSGGPGTNPEQLFACGYGACFGQAVKVMAGMEGLEPESVSINAIAQLNKNEEGGFFLSVTLNGSLPGLSQDEAEKLMRLAHEICPYSKATHGNIEVTLEANGTAMQEAA